MDLPSDEVAVALAPPELAGYLLMAFLRRWRSEGKPLLFGHVMPHEKREHEDVRLAYTEAWCWLLHEGLVVPDERPFQMGGAEFLVPSRRARGIENIEAFERVPTAGLLPRDLIHPSIRLQVESDFITGQYDTAVFKAFRQVEISVRSAAGLPNACLGTDLMRQAFKETTGKLRQADLEKAERESMAHLFAGAAGLYGNSTRHRDVGLTPEKSIELFILASHLLRIVDERRSAAAPSIQ